MDSKKLALRPISTKKVDGSFGGKAAVARERSSLANASFRVYYSLRAGAVPFLWESKPGTPKSGAGATAAVSPAEMSSTTAELLPPISPPPSYQSSQLKGRRRCRPRSSWPAAGVLRALLGVLGLRKSHRRSHGPPTSDL
ncbi:uncharacterized protein LOC133914068 [Phragmites australis]|uniref:uncharacterized protein LOC133914068 n=1 Tax=Phragmites australis TaxID=29695 RepID=UPI002D79539B|nr:uncharacterized protein LOC133914068 [Phragmites australis]